MYIIKSDYLYYTLNRFLSQIVQSGYTSRLNTYRLKQHYTMLKGKKINFAIFQRAVVNYLIALIMQSRSIYMP